MRVWRDERGERERSRVRESERERESEVRGVRESERV